MPTRGRTASRRVSGRRAGALSTRQQNAKNFLALFAAGDVWFDADNLSGTSFVDYRDPTHLAVAAGVPGAATADPLFPTNCKTVAITGTQWWDSNRAASAWNHRVDGTGDTTVYVFAPTNLAAARILGACGTGATGVGFDTYVTAAGGASYDVYGAAGALRLSRTLPAATFAVNTATYLTTTLATASGSIRVKSAAASAVAPGALTSPPASTFRFGAYADGSFPGHQKVRAIYNFRRVLTSAQYATVCLKIFYDTGIAP